mmetsp:Transcript_40666/g.79554  ORF Transcript_40666/g.79554 Transcript_40666/m.79554 type:complete len:215 (-) Transcript_40666:743-1387(-)
MDGVRDVRRNPSLAALLSTGASISRRGASAWSGASGCPRNCGATCWRTTTGGPIRSSMPGTSPWPNPAPEGASPSRSTSISIGCSTWTRPAPASTWWCGSGSGGRTRGFRGTPWSTAGWTRCGSGSRAAMGTTRCRRFGRPTCTCGMRRFLYRSRSRTPRRWSPATGRCTGRGRAGSGPSATCRASRPFPSGRCSAQWRSDRGRCPASTSGQKN